MTCIFFSIGFQRHGRESRLPEDVPQPVELAKSEDGRGASRVPDRRHVLGAWSRNGRFRN